MSFLHTISQLDTDLLLLINGLHNQYFDVFMTAFSAVKIWIPFYLSVIYILVVTAKKQSLWMILSLVLCIVIADQVASGIIKDAVQRLRPSQNPVLDGLVHIVNGYKGGRYGFVSSHAANSFGFALLSAMLLRNNLYTFMVFVWAFVVSYSRMYLGVHYPLDIIGGLLVGFSAALFCYYLLSRFFVSTTSFKFNFDTIRIPFFVLLISYFGIAVYSFF